MKESGMGVKEEYISKKKQREGRVRAGAANFHKRDSSLKNTSQILSSGFFNIFAKLSACVVNFFYGVFSGIR